MSSLSVILVSHYFPPHVGGIEEVVAAEAAELTRRGHDVAVLTTAPTRHARNTHRDGYPVIAVGSWNGIERRAGVPFPVPLPRAWSVFLRRIRTSDVVHVHDLLYPTTWLAVACAALCRTPVILTQHVHLVDHPSRVVVSVQRAVHRTIGRLVVRCSAHVVVINDTIKDFVTDLGADPARVSFVPNGVDHEVFHPGDTAEKSTIRRRFGLPVDDVLALFVGRFAPKKGFQALLAAAGPAYRIVFVGGGRPTGAADSGQLIFLGNRPRLEVAELYRACDIFVLPSRGEGFPLAAQEAMASALPVVLTDDPAYRSYRLESGAVTLIDPAPGPIRRALTHFAGHPGDRARSGVEAARFARRQFSWTTHTDRLCGIYAEATLEKAR